VCHGYAAYKLGDKTAKNLGRLSLNPLKHLDPIGTLCMVLFRIGWAKPVPINPRNFKNPKRDFALTAVAGPLSNLILGFLSAGIFLLANALLREVAFTERNFAFNLASNTLTFLYLFYSINIGFGLFNLLPIPPFDGSRIVHAVLPEKAYFGIMKYERQIYYVTLGWLLLGDFVAMAVRSIPLVAASPVLYTIAGVFSLSGMISAVIDFVGGLMLSFWQLIPFLKL
jgi:Zn-dependent protease